MPMNRANYPENWPEISMDVRTDARWKCERCGIAQGALTKSGGKVVLTVAHLNHDTSDNRRENLRAWCQRCHLTYDAKLHAGHAKETRQRRKEEAIAASGQMSLFAEM